MPEVTAIKPDAVPPGWEGDVVFTGKNFAEKMKLRMDCGNFKPEGFHVESVDRAVFHVKVPPEAEDTKCLIALEVPPGGATAETGPAVEGTPQVGQVMQVTGANFAISSSSTLAVARGACLMSEGPIGREDDPASTYEAYLNAQIEFQKKWETNPAFLQECQMYVSPDSVKYVQSGKTVFEKPASAVKKVEKFFIPGPIGDMPSDVFSITWADGKIQNFMGVAKDGLPPSQAYDDLKQKLKK